MKTSTPLLTANQQTALEYLNAEMVCEGSAADRARARYYCKLEGRWCLITLPDLETLGDSLASEYEENWGL